LPININFQFQYKVVNNLKEITNLVSASLNCGSYGAVINYFEFIRIVEEFK